MLINPLLSIVLLNLCQFLNIKLPKVCHSSSEQEVIMLLMILCCMLKFTRWKRNRIQILFGIGIKHFSCFKFDWLRICWLIIWCGFNGNNKQKIMLILIPRYKLERGLSAKKNRILDSLLYEKGLKILICFRLICKLSDQYIIYLVSASGKNWPK